MMVFRKNGTYDWMISNDYEGTRVEFEGTSRKAHDLFNHLKAMSEGTTNLYRNGKLVK